MLSSFNCSSSLKSDGLITNSKVKKSSRVSSNNCLLFNNKDIHRRFSNMKSMDITSRLGQFAWRQIIPSNVFLPVIFRHNNRDEYLCVQMIKIHLLSCISSETISYWMKRCPIDQFSLTIYEAQLFHHINVFHSNGLISKNNQLNYSTLESATITPFHSFLRFYQVIYSNSQLINSNQLTISSHLSSTYHKSTTDKEEQIVNNNMYQSSKTKSNESSNSFCRQIIFHGKEILSYCTTSSIHFNEKDNQTISCLAIKDIISIYFPWSSIEQFIQICRKKQITRFKPDKSTDCDSTLRLVNMQELENHWNFILKELLPNTQTSLHKHSLVMVDQSEKDKLSENNLPLKMNSNDILSSNVNNEDTNKIIESPLKETLIENCSIEIDNLKIKENSDNQSNEQENNGNQSEIELQENKEEEESLTIIEENCLTNKKSLTTKRRRRINSYFSSKRRRKQKSKTNANENKSSSYDEQFWMKKYSIEPFSILIDRYQLPID